METEDGKMEQLPIRLTEIIENLNNDKELSKDNPFFEHYSEFCSKSFVSLKKFIELVQATNEKIVDGEDSFFEDNINFYTKSFMVLMCAYLENYLKDILMHIINIMNNRLHENKIPFNLIKWSLDPNQEWKTKNENFTHFLLTIDKTGKNQHKKALDEFISGMPYRTEEIFKKFGIELHKNPQYFDQKQLIADIVNKRNQIMHHNDEASDISLGDIKNKIKEMQIYICIIDNIVSEFLK